MQRIFALSKVSGESAEAKKKEIITALNSLAQAPQCFPFFKEMYITPNKYHGVILQNCYLVFYQILDDKVYVDYILDCRKDYRWLINQQ